MSDRDLFTTDSLHQILGARPFRFEPTAGSTNDLALDWALHGAKAGSVVIADEQTAGRGRFGRTWIAPAGTSLLLSVILRPPVTLLTRLTILGAVATAEAIRETLGAKADLVAIKWPNDVLIEGLKTAGILAESRWEGETLAAAVLGIGINVHTDFADSPLAGRATSLDSVRKTITDRYALLSRLLARIDHWSARLDDPALIQTWTAMLDTLGKTVTARGEKTELRGIASAVDDSGALLLKVDDGTIHRISAGEVTLAD